MIRAAEWRLLIQSNRARREAIRNTRIAAARAYHAAWNLPAPKVATNPLREKPTANRREEIRAYLDRLPLDIPDVDVLHSMDRGVKKPKAGTPEDRDSQRRRSNGNRTIMRWKLRESRRLRDADKPPPRFPGGYMD